MNFRAQLLPIDDQNPTANDRIGRNREVRNLANLLKNINEKTVVAVNGPWGRGKTTFLSMLKSTLNNEGFPTVYFSAWETDFAPDPLVAFLGEMDKSLKKNLNGKTVGTKAWDSAKSIGVHLFQRALPVLVSTTTGGIVDGKWAADQLSSLAGQLTEDAIKNYQDTTNQIERFKKQVEKTIKATGKIYIFVDELDRCRPTYAIELLERIKHLFDIDGIVFVLGIDKEQLAHSIKGVYGAEFNSMNYLRRFIDIEYALPPGSIENFIDFTCEQFGIKKWFAERADMKHEYKLFKNLIEFFCCELDLSLRDIEQIMARIKLILLAIHESVELPIIMSVFLVIIRQEYSEDYVKFQHNQMKGASRLIEILHSLVPEEKRWESRAWAVIESALLLAQGEKGKQRIRDYESVVADPSSKNGDKWYAKTILEFVGANNQWWDFTSTLKRVSMLDDFVFQ